MSYFMSEAWDRLDCLGGLMHHSSLASYAPIAMLVRLLFFAAMEWLSHLLTQCVTLELKGLH